jgi:hypothetical protein
MYVLQAKQTNTHTHTHRMIHRHTNAYIDRSIRTLWFALFHYILKATPISINIYIYLHLLYDQHLYTQRYKLYVTVFKCKADCCFVSTIRRFHYICACSILNSQISVCIVITHTHTQEHTLLNISHTHHTYLFVIHKNCFSFFKIIFQNLVRD